MVGISDQGALSRLISIITNHRSSLRESVSKIAPLVVIHREVQEPDICEIGQITALDAESFQLREIDPDANWAEEISTFRYDDITRVGFAGEYEGALALVAGVVV